MPLEDSGFRLSSRIAPRKFRGVIVEISKKLNDDEYKKSVLERLAKETKELVEHRRKHPGPSGESVDDEIKELRRRAEYYIKESSEYFKYAEETRPEKWQERVNQVVEEMIDVNNDKPENLVPIYDIYGNLMWPEQMSYKEVQEYVEEREGKKLE